MSYFQRLAAQSRPAAAPRPGTDSVVASGSVADIVEIEVGSDAFLQRTADARASASTVRATIDSTTAARTRHSPTALDADRGSARPDGPSSGHARDRIVAPERGDRPAHGPAMGTSAARSGDDDPSPASNEAIALAQARHGDPDDVLRARVSGDPSDDSPRISAADPVPRNPAQPQDDPAGPTAAVLDADASSTTSTSGGAQAAASDSRPASIDPQAIAANSSDAAAAAIATALAGEGRRADANAMPASATRAKAGRAASDPAPKNPAPRIEVRFGRVSVEVHAAAPTPPAPVAAPVVQIVAPAAAPAFAPSRHYLRMD